MGARSKDLLMARHTQSVLLTNITKTQTPNHSGHEREASSLSSRNRQHVKSKHNCYQETFPRSVLLEPLLSHPTASYVGIQRFSSAAFTSSIRSNSLSVLPRPPAPLQDGSAVSPLFFPTYNTRAALRAVLQVTHRMG